MAGKGFCLSFECLKFCVYIIYIIYYVITLLEYVCRACDQVFDFQSRYDRHLQSASHKRNVAFETVADYDEYAPEHGTDPQFYESSGTAVPNASVFQHEDECTTGLKQPEYTEMDLALHLTGGGSSDDRPDSSEADIFSGMQVKSQTLYILITACVYCIKSVDVEDLTYIETLEKDFSPFTSKAQALLFMLLHSPRPIVST